MAPQSPEFLHPRHIGRLSRQRSGDSGSWRARNARTDAADPRGEVSGRRGGKTIRNGAETPVWESHGILCTGEDLQRR